MNTIFQEIVSKISRFGETAKDLIELQEFTVKLIAERLSYYDWVGFYMLDANDSDSLVLDPFRGAPTEHVRIPANRGIRGAAVAQGRTIIVDDVASDPRYLACSLETRSIPLATIWIHTVQSAIDIPPDRVGRATLYWQIRGLVEKGLLEVPRPCSLICSVVASLAGKLAGNIAE